MMAHPTDPVGPSPGLRGGLPGADRAVVPASRCETDRARQARVDRRDGQPAGDERFAEPIDQLLRLGADDPSWAAPSCGRVNLLATPQQLMNEPAVVARVMELAAARAAGADGPATANAVAGADRPATTGRVAGGAARADGPVTARRAAGADGPAAAGGAAGPARSRSRPTAHVGPAGRPPPIAGAPGAHPPGDAGPDRRLNQGERVTVHDLIIRAGQVADGTGATRPRTADVAIDGDRITGVGQVRGTGAAGDRRRRAAGHPGLGGHPHPLRRAGHLGPRGLAVRLARSDHRSSWGTAASVSPRPGPPSGPGSSSSWRAWRTSRAPPWPRA